MQHTVPARRAYIAKRAEQFLPPGTVIRHIFVVQCYFPWLPGIVDLLCSPFLRDRIVAVADGGIYVLASSSWSWRWRPTRLLRTLPRNTMLEPLWGLFFFWRVQLGPERVWINWRFLDDLRAADDGIMSM